MNKMEFHSKIRLPSPPAFYRRPSTSSTFSSNSSSSSAASSLLSPPPVLMHHGWSPAPRAATATTEDYFSISSALSSPSSSALQTLASSPASISSSPITPPTAISEGGDYFSLPVQQAKQQFQRPQMPSRRHSSLTPSDSTPSSLALLSAPVTPSTAYPSWPSRDSLSTPIIADYDSSNHGSSYVSDDDLQSLVFATSTSTPNASLDALATSDLADKSSCVGLGLTAASLKQGKKSMQMISSTHKYASPEQAVGFSWTGEQGLKELEKNLEVEERRYVRRAPPPGMAMCATGAKKADKKEKKDKKKVKVGSAKSATRRGVKRGLEIVVEEC